MTSETTECTTTMEALPWNCLFQILQYIPVLERVALRRVSKAWRDTIDHWWCTVKSLSTDDYSDTGLVTLDEGTLLVWTQKLTLTRGVLTHCASHLTHLEINRWGDDHDDFPLLSLAAEKCRNLKSFHTSIGSAVQDKELCVLLQNNPNIRRFWLSPSSGHCFRFFEYLPVMVDDLYVYFTNPEQNNATQQELERLRESFSKTYGSTIAGLKEFMGKASNLRKLLINYSSPEVLEAIGRARSLESLTIDETAMDDAREFNANEPSKWSYLFNLENLKEIDINGIPSLDEFNANRQPITDDVVVGLVRYCPLLESVALNDWNGLTDKSIHALSSLQHLKLLWLHCWRSSGGITDKFLPNFINIEELRLVGLGTVGDPGVIGLLRNCRTIRTLGLIGTGITNDTLKAAVEETGRRTNGVKLVVDVSRCMMDVGRRRVDVSRLENNSPLLEIIDD